METKLYTTETIKLAGKKKVTPSEVLFLKADVNYTEVFLQDGEKVIVSKTLKELEKDFINHDFFRTHKSYMVNLHHVTGYQIHEGLLVKVHNEHQVSLSRRRKDVFLLTVSKFKSGLN
ncbi:LytR/AlgR family response regulator transcription factor [Emticicia sp. 17c]|uniref:LytR/AlgR family response regulator transcription factor n=1 Tax=Emticicia sp. 17c TaxID=3127704 RepID=UPI00301CCEDA